MKLYLLYIKKYRKKEKYKRYKGNPAAKFLQIPRNVDIYLF